MFIIENLYVKTCSGEGVNLSLNVPDGSTALLVDGIGICFDELVDKILDPDVREAYSTRGKPLVFSPETYSMDMNSLREILHIINTEQGGGATIGINTPYEFLANLLEVVGGAGKDIILYDPLLYTPRSYWGMVITGINKARANGSSIIIYTYTPETYRGIFIDKVYRITEKGAFRGFEETRFKLKHVLYMIKTGDRGIIDKLPGVEGYIVLNRDTLLVLIDRRRFYDFRRELINLYYAGAIRGFKQVIKGVIEFD